MCRRRLGALALVLVTACLPALSDVEGRACNADKPCPDDLSCFEGACTRTIPSPMPVTVFEDGCEAGVTNWKGFNNASLAQVRMPVTQGTFACSVAAAEMATSFGTELERDRVPLRKGRYCATMSLARGNVTPQLVLSLRSHQGTAAAGLLDSSAATDASMLRADAGAGYQTLRAELEVNPGGTPEATGVSLAVTGPLVPRATFFFDAVRVQVVASGACP